MARTYFKRPRWIKLMTLAIGLVSFVIAFSYGEDESLWVRIFYFGFGTFGMLSFIESVTAYMHLGKNELEFRENFKIHKININDIKKVTWESGCGVSVLLRNGAWEKIPTLSSNSQGISNSIRAWLKQNQRTDA